ncbi:MAG: DUF1571 domain-containing protein [Planctomycetales bacterium]
MRIDRMPHTRAGTTGWLLDRRRVVRLLAACAVAVAAGPLLAQSRVASRPTEAADNHPLSPAIRYARTGYDALDKVQDYHARFVKQEWIDGGFAVQTMEMKLREKPFSVYLKFGPPHEGREVLYVDGRNGGQLLARDSGIKSLVGTISLDPTGRTAMAGNRYPVTMIGMRKMLDSLVAQWEQDRRQADVAVKYYPDAKVGDLRCKVIESTIPTRREGAKFHRTRLYLDADNGLPIRLQQYDWPAQAGAEPPLVEEYSYLELRTNLGLADGDFDVKNPEYGF